MGLPGVSKRHVSSPFKGGTDLVHKALVAGANGIIGKALLEELARAPGWEAQGLSRSHGDILADLSDAPHTRKALEGAADCTHLFYAAYGSGGGLAEEDTRNSAMLRNLLDGLKHVGAPLTRVVLYQGAKVYGVHLGPVSTPFYEDENPRPIGPNFYFTQERELQARHEAGGPAWTILRPDVVVGDAAGNAMNIATVIGAYAAICAADQAAFRFPGSYKTYDRCLAQVTDAHALARASLWAATSEAAVGQAFNYVHAPFRWRRIWERLAQHFGLAVGEPIPFSLAGHMPALAPIWGQIGKHLVQPDFAKAVGWGFGDFVFGTEVDVVSDMTKIRLAGYTEDADPLAVLINAIERQQKQGVIPRVGLREG
ncbi:NAD-dependent epimerase/dehydratase family protein [Gluconacetobacter azotocaptans]|uniref:NAD-dependent epimerase/dehydratase family protein n=1 Tax=Gluconacetobacter azotocaptans TaxID=142834 RepID=UPI001F04C494|nr:NAD-dependent epimerase/dehydratase family protein [Gluconacetobacter azotocaptans]